MSNAIRKLLLVMCITCLPFYAAQSYASGKDETLPEQDYSIEVSKGKLIRLSSPASSVIAADPTIADVQVISPSLIYVNGKGVGETTVFAVDSKDAEVLHAVINVTNNLSRLSKEIREMLPDSQVSVQSVGGALVVKGDVDSPLQAEDVRKIATPFVKQGQTLVNMLRPLGSNQVMLKVKVAEVSRTVLKQFGISLQNLSLAGNFSFGVFNNRNFIDNSTTPATFVRDGTVGSLFGGFSDSHNSINGVIDALENNGLVTTLAEPTLTTQSGQKASFLAGGEIPIPIVTGTGSSAQVSINYQPYGVSLSFVPSVLSKSRINLTVSPEVSSLTQTGAVSTAGFNIPALQTRKASTTVELGSGQSFAIAGLIENDRNNDITKFPFLGDMPILGTLFRSSEFHNNQTELVIIVTPYIVDAVNNPKALHDPTEGLVLSSDFERILLGKLYKEMPPGYSHDADAPHLHGAAGYQLK
ncbi:MAG TPA: type II and III secretion system protein family protein [Rickettsiales bacterium]|nr:type II and III secretion system protein family protein [Rickettsiales bacterium]